MRKIRLRREKGRGAGTSRTGLCGHFPETAIRRAVRNAPEVGNPPPDPILRRRPRNSGGILQFRPDFGRDRRPRCPPGGALAEVDSPLGFRSKSGGKNRSVDLHYIPGVGIQIFPAEKKLRFCAFRRKKNCAFEFPRACFETPRRKQLAHFASSRSRNPAGFCTI